MKRARTETRDRPQTFLGMWFQLYGEIVQLAEIALCRQGVNVANWSVFENAFFFFLITFEQNNIRKLKG